MSATRSSWRIAAIRAKIRLQGAGKEDFGMLKLFAGTLVFLSLAAGQLCPAPPPVLLFAKRPLRQ